MEQILELLARYEKRHNLEDVRIEIYKNGSGYIYYPEEGRELGDFHNEESLIQELKK